MDSKILLLSPILPSSASTQDLLVYGCLCAFLAWRMLHIADVYFHRPKNIMIAGLASISGKCISSLIYIFSATRLIGKVYREVAHIPYALPTADRYLVLVRSKQQIDELDRVPEHHVSFHTAMTDRVFHKYTMNGFEYDKDDPYSTVSVKALRICLRSKLPDLQPTMQQKVEAFFKREILLGKMTDGWVTLRTFPVATRLTANINASVIVGERLARNPEYFEAAARYSYDAAVATEILRFTPTCLHTLMGPLVMRWTGSMQKVVGFITPEVEDRLRIGHPEDHLDTNQDCLQWLIEQSRVKGEPSVSIITQKALGFIFAFAHQIAMSLTFAVHNLCKHPEYLEPLRQEITNLSVEKCKDNVEDLPLLDSFLKESARLNPLDSLSIQRRALFPYTFADGTHVPARNWIAVPQRAMMQDPDIYPDPERFDGFRFVASHNDMPKSKSRFTHPSWSFPYWGSVRRACPARFYASRLLKLILVHLIITYDFKLADEKASQNFSWNTTIVPRSSTAIMATAHSIRQRIEELIFLRTIQL